MLKYMGVRSYYNSRMEEGKRQQGINVESQVEKKAQQQLSQPKPEEEEKVKNEASSALREELLSMQFQPTLVDRALQHASNIQQAIEFIVSALEEQDIRQISKMQDVAMILLVRIDLKMGLGKVAAQCAHATLKAYQLARTRVQNDEKYSLSFIQWLQSGQEKYAYQVDNEEQLFDTLKRFQAMGVGTCYIRDAGRTQIAAGSATVGGVGPWNVKQLQQVTRALRRL